MDKEHNSSDTIESFCKNKRMIISKNMKNVIRKPPFLYVGLILRIMKVTTLSLVK